MSVKQERAKAAKEDAAIRATPDNPDCEPMPEVHNVGEVIEGSINNPNLVGRDAKVIEPTLYPPPEATEGGQQVIDDIELAERQREASAKAQK